jgi:hypothetical protein
VDEIACLIDFGVQDDVVMRGLENLNVLRILANPRPLTGDEPAGEGGRLAATAA